MNRVLSAALVAATMAGVSGAHASTYLQCTDGFHQLRGNPGRNPPVSATVARQDDGRWSVVYVLRDGQTVMRENQYDIADKGNGVSWTGWRAGKQMRASIEHYHGRLIYAEAVYDNGEKLIGSNYIDCGPAPADEPDYTPTPAPAAPIIAQAPAPPYIPPATPTVPLDPSPVALGVGDSVPFAMVHGGMEVLVDFPGWRSRMIVDTGAGMGQIQVSLADNLLASGHATELTMERFCMANGQCEMQRVVLIDTLTLGRRIVHNVRMSVVPDSVEQLLGLPILNAIGKFTIDGANRQLTFS
jgi:hypothetical protein